MRPTVLELLASVRWTLAERIAPTLSDPLAQSYGRSIMATLAGIEVRLRNEGAVVTEEVADLRELLGRGADLVQPADLEAAAAEVDFLRNELIDVIRSGEGDRDAIHRYYARQLERDARLAGPVGDFY
jgi:ubiquinone biosynthesis protein UbiJ